MFWVVDVGSEARAFLDRADSADSVDEACVIGGGLGTKKGGGLGWLECDYIERVGIERFEWWFAQVRFVVKGVVVIEVVNQDLQKQPYIATMH